MLKCIMTIIFVLGYLVELGLISYFIIDNAKDVTSNIFTVGDKIIAHFRDWDADHYYMECGPELTEWALSNSILLEFYKEGRKLLKKPIKKYRIKLWKGETEEADNGYLNICYRTNRIAISDKYELGDWRTSFTKKEIEELKKRDDIAIDWNKVELEEVDE